MLHWILWGLVLGFYSPVLIELYRSRWEQVDYTHAYFILPLSLWFVWRMRAKLKELVKQNEASLITTRPLAWSGYLFLIILGVLMFSFGWRRDYLLITSLSLIPLLFGITGYVYGSRVAFALRFPILFLLLMMPPPLGVLDSITIPLRYGISIAVSKLLLLFKIPITRDGLILSLGGHEVYMGPACSGFRSLITMITLGITYTYIIKGSFAKKAILLGSVVPLALLGNFARVAGVCLVTYYVSESAGQKFHDIAGYVIFVLLIFCLMGLDILLDRRSK